MISDDLEYDECLARLSVPADDPAGVSRRRFLQGVAATATASAVLPSFLASGAGAATLGSSEGVLVLIMLGGGNDGLNTLVPYGQGAYYDLRGRNDWNLSILQNQVLPLDGTYGLNPALPKLKARYDAGKVAVVRGVGQPADDLSHFTSMATFMAGTATTSRTSGWVGRWADGLADSPDGLRVVTSGSSIPLHLIGSRATVTAISGDGDLFGSNTTDAYEMSAQDAASAFGAQTVGKGAWADRFATAGRNAMGTARAIAPAFATELPGGDLVPQLVGTARLINADLGIRVFNTSFGSFDTHDNQDWMHTSLLTELDNAIDAFYAALDPRFASRVTLLTFSEFGRRPQANSSNGCDHGTASSWFVVGDQVRGGMHGDHPSLSALDSRGNLARTVDFRSVYATVLDGWLGGGADAVLGASYPRLDLFARSPGQGGTTTPPPPGPNPAAPFASWTAMVQQQYLDILGRVGDTGGVQTWVNALQGGSLSPASLIDQFIKSNEFAAVVAPAARLYWAYFRRDPDVDGLLYWAGRLRAGAGLLAVSDAFAASPEFTSTYGSLSDGAFVDLVYRNVLGRAPDAGGLSYWTGQLQQRRITRGGVMVGFSESAEYRNATAAAITVVMTYAAMLRRAPDAGGRAYWINQVQTGATSSTALIGGIYGSAEYTARFGG